ncbi:aromatic ring-hydroxylating dioxygenase subunit alpha [Paraburkholderia sp. USG1]|uniref:aromatic ring-hydroxylating oxygenase subunit alpha n=1 Tax=Paraburkholderia sp. USG1 TaxID=2952268 RepID=UPI002857D058|nr:aromatic ring-hydroxylating dioxygenase subunit alpha [Paraburkholderia sp. USG1]MDR8394711.1 aromatic ring-hydroxylating dioxygenase subunit alpha [Paraburkholderia sp. USG1]
MDQEFERTLLRRWFDLRDANTTSMSDAVHREPTVHYTDPHRFDQEMQAFFRGAPRIVGLSCDLPRAGEFFTVDVGSVPVLVVRGEDGGVRAFLNVCRHRGGSVAQGRGAAGRLFKCSYHAWSYDTKGRLLGQPSAQESFDDVKPGCTGLIPLAAAEANGLIFVRPTADGDPIDVDSELAGLAPQLSKIDFDGFRFFAERHSSWAMNWKQPFDTFLEAYHIFSLHRDSLSKEVLSTPMLVESSGPHGLGLVMSRSGLRLLDRDEREWHLRGHGNLFFWLFPNTILNLPAPGHVELWQFYPENDAVDQTRVHVRFYTPGEPESEKERTFWDKMVDFTMSFVGEDFEQQKTIFSNLRAGILPELIFGRNEPALTHYHHNIDRALRAANASPQAREPQVDHTS